MHLWAIGVSGLGRSFFEALSVFLESFGHGPPLDCTFGALQIGSSGIRFLRIVNGSFKAELQRRIG